ncbi:MAG: potassium channel protein, partial [Candidatus Aenigmarchaeota archaeon]|nr:potassium channel protein [Candidatus Aenigmarchaeota archaeon]
MGNNIKELLEELKNLSELMLDLAYSAVFFENKEIAKEVLLLHERLEDIEEDLYMHLFAVSKKMSPRLISVIELVETSKDVALAAKNIAEMVIDGKSLHPVIKQALSEADESIVMVKVKKSSLLSNKTLGDVKLRSNTGIDVIAIRRGKRWIFDPQKNTRIKPGDVLICIGTVE